MAESTYVTKDSFVGEPDINEENETMMALDGRWALLVINHDDLSGQIAPSCTPAVPSRQREQEEQETKHYY